MLLDCFHCFSNNDFKSGGRQAGNDYMKKNEIEIPVLMNDVNIGYPCNHSGCKLMLLHYLVLIDKMNRIGEDLL